MPVLTKSFISAKEICESRGQNPYIGAELNDMLSKQDSVKVVQYESKDCDMSKYGLRTRNVNIK